MLDVVYNHTFNTAESNFERTVPGYFYRQKKDGTFADGSACGNETASDRAMMRNLHDRVRALLDQRISPGWFPF